MEIPDINIEDIYIPDVYTFYKPETASPLQINVPGCTYQHRDIKNTGNINLLLDDPNGVFFTCDAPFPSFNPMNYEPNNLIMAEDVPIQSSEPEVPEPKPPVTQKFYKKTSHYVRMIVQKPMVKPWYSETVNLLLHPVLIFPVNRLQAFL